MSKIKDAVANLQKIDELARGDGFLCSIHPLAKFILTIIFLVLVVSYGTRELSGLLGMGIYLFIIYEMGNISLIEAVYRMRIILPFVCVVGIFNPFFDREILFYLGDFGVTGGMLSMVTLIFKGVFTVLASYALIVTTTMESICYAMRLLHVPKILVTEFMLIYRYIQLLLRETEKVTQSYFLRAPGQKGINIKAWGPLVGLMLLRSLDRAETIYKSMCLRGFHEEYYYAGKREIKIKDWLFFFSMATVIILLRAFPILEIVGKIWV